MQRILSVLSVLLVAMTVYGQINPGFDVKRLCQDVANRMGSHYIRHRGNCSLFYNCDGDLSFPVLLSCQYPLVFSQSQQVCVYKNDLYDDCQKKVFTGGFNSPRCRTHRSGVNRDPEDCHRFIPCWLGNAYPSMPCQGNLRFDERIQRCVEPGKIPCPTRPQH